MTWQRIERYGTAAAVVLLAVVVAWMTANVW